MRNIIVLLVLVILQASTVDVYSQEDGFSLHYSDTRLIKVLDAIENGSNFFFLYNEKLLDTDRKVSIDSDGKSIEDILATLFSGTGINYTIIDRKIILAPDYLSVSKEEFVSDQNQVVTGKVINGITGEPLPGAIVRVIHNDIGSIADENGKYSITVPDRSSTLLFSFIGFLPKEIMIDGRLVIDTSLEPGTEELEEVMVIGYGTRLKESLTGSVSSIKAKSIESSTASSVINRMQGNVSGVTISTNAYPGAAATILIHGIGSLRDNSPLFIVDGYPGSALNINPNDIESIYVLKDASSTAIYGARGANGVVIIKTKRGKENSKDITFSYRTGFSYPYASKYDLLNTREYGQLRWLEAKNMGNGDPSNELYKWENWSLGQQGIDDFTIVNYILPAGNSVPDNYEYDYYSGKLIIKANKVGTDWFDEVYQNAPINEFNLSGSGGGENSNYNFSCGYFNEAGILKWTGFERFTFRANSDLRLSKWLTIGESLGAMYNDYKGNPSASFGNFHQVMQMQPISPVYDEMGNFAGGIVRSLGAARNPVAILYQTRDRFNRTLSATGNFYIKVRPLKYIEATSKFGYLLSHNFYRYPTRRDPYNYNRYAPTEILTMSSTLDRGWNWHNTLGYSRKFRNIHSIDVIAGIEANDIVDYTFGASRRQFLSDDGSYMQIDAGETNIMNWGDALSSSLYSLFSRLNYDFKDKYLFQASIRRDGSSKFAPGNRFGNFPAFSAGWKITNENFLSFTKSWLDLMTIRFGWGAVGNDNIKDYAPYDLYKTSTAINHYPITGSNIISSVGFDLASLENLDVGWETTTTTNLGFDMAFLNRSLTMTFDIWDRTTTDMLYQIQIPDVFGMAQLAFVNVGNMQNRGVDLDIEYRHTSPSRNFRYGIKATISHYRNEIMKLNENIDEILEGITTNGNVWTRAQIGSAFPQFWGYIVDGIFQTQEEADAYPQAFGGDYNKPGHFKYRDVFSDGVIDEKDMTWIGNPHPDFTGGLNLDLGYKNFDLSLFFYGSYGNDIVYDNSKLFDFSYSEGNRSKDRLYYSWGSPYLKDNADARLPMADRDVNSYVSSSFFIKDGSFLRLQNLQLGYTFPKKITSKLNVNDINIYVQAVNLFIITRYPGLDPELNQTGINMGIDDDSWPHPKQFIFGVKLKI